VPYPRPRLDVVPTGRDPDTDPGIVGRRRSHQAGTTWMARTASRTSFLRINPQLDDPMTVARLARPSTCSGHVTRLHSAPRPPESRGSHPRYPRRYDPHTARIPAERCSRGNVHRSPVRQRPRAHDSILRSAIPPPAGPRYFDPPHTTDPGRTTFPRERSPKSSSGTGLRRAGTTTQRNGERARRGGLRRRPIAAQERDGAAGPWLGRDVPAASYARRRSCFLRQLGPGSSVCACVDP
jgi:hypothetical protein